MATKPAPVLSDKKTKSIIGLLLLVVPIMGFAIDLIAPSLPAITQDLHVSASLVGELISFYVLGYGLGNFLTGFLSDAWGRKSLLRFSLLAFVLISLLPILFPSIHILLVVRFFQGMALGAVAVLIRAIFSDIVPPENLVRLGTLMGTMFGLGPVLGPVIGGYLQFYLGWEAGFYFLSGMAFLSWIFIFIMIPETHFSRHPLAIKTIRKNLGEVLSHRFFMALVFLMGLSYSLIIVFQTMGPFFIQATLNKSPIFFGHLALGLGSSFLLSTFVCRFFLKRASADRLFFVVTHLFLALSLIASILSLIFPHSLLLLTLISVAMFFFCGFMFPLSMGKGMSLFRHISGTATASMYLVNMAITSLSSFLVSFIHAKTVFPILVIYSVLLLITLGIYWRRIRPAIYIQET